MRFIDGIQFLKYDIETSIQTFNYQFSLQKKIYFPGFYARDFQR